MRPSSLAQVDAKAQETPGPQTGTWIQERGPPHSRQHPPFLPFPTQNTTVSPFATPATTVQSLVIVDLLFFLLPPRLRLPTSSSISGIPFSSTPRPFASYSFADLPSAKPFPLALVAERNSHRASDVDVPPNVIHSRPPKLQLPGDDGEPNLIRRHRWCLVIAPVDSLRSTLHRTSRTSKLINQSR